MSRMSAALKALEHRSADRRPTGAEQHPYGVAPVEVQALATAAAVERLIDALCAEEALGGDAPAADASEGAASGERSASSQSQSGHGLHGAHDLQHGNSLPVADQTHRGIDAIDARPAECRPLAIAVVQPWPVGVVALAHALAAPRPSIESAGWLVQLEAPGCISDVDDPVKSTTADVAAGTPPPVAGDAEPVAEQAGEHSPDIHDTDARQSDFVTDVLNDLAADPLASQGNADSAPAAAQPALPIWKLAGREPGRGYRDLAARIVRDAGSRDTSTHVLITAVRDAALGSMSLAQLAAALGSVTGNVLLVDGSGNVPAGRAEQIGPRPPGAQRPLSPHQRCQQQAGPAQPAQCPPGLRQILAGSADWPQVTRATNLPGVSIVGPGYCESSMPSESIGQPTACLVLPTSFRYVLVALAACDEPLTLQLAALCRSTYLVVELGKERKQATGGAISVLERAGAHLRGAIALDRLRSTR